MLKPAGRTSSGPNPTENTEIYITTIESSGIKEEDFKVKRESVENPKTVENALQQAQAQQTGSSIISAAESNDAKWWEQPKEETIQTPFTTEIKQKKSWFERLCCCFSNKK
jgi:hypothetical protein